jgi:hypothetical protein
MMEMEKLFERLLARMDTARRTHKEEMLAELDARQEKVEANRKKEKEDLMAKLDAYQAKTEAGHKELLSRLEDDRQAERREWKEMMGTSQMEMVAENKPERDRETMACRETMEARLEEKEPT